MRNISLSLMISMALWLGACTGVGFEQPQPAGISDLREIPVNLQGIYANGDNDSLVVSPDQIVYYGMNPQLQFSMKTKDLVFRRWEGFWVVNIRSNKFWEVFLCKDYGDSLVAMYIPGRYGLVMEEAFDWMKQYANGRAIDPAVSGEAYEFVVNPDSATFRQMVQKGFFKVSVPFIRKR